MQFVGEERQHKGQIMALKRVYKKFFKNSASTLLTILEVVKFSQTSQMHHDKEERLEIILQKEW